MFFEKSRAKYDFLMANAENFIVLDNILEEGNYTSVQGTKNTAEKLKITAYTFLEESLKGEEADESKMEQYGKEFEEAYRAVMLNGNMVKFEAAKTAIDDMMNEIMGILALCIDGQDPATCEPAHEHSCGGSCESCGGCH